MKSKMEVFGVTPGCKYGRLFSLELLLLAAACVQLANGQQGVSLVLHGVTIPNNSLVEFEDTLYTTNDGQNPTNGNGRHDQTLVCETDLIDCCDAPMTVSGNWYFPNGDVVTDTGTLTFRSNRGPNEVRNEQQFYGSVRLYRRYTPEMSQRGRFRCELPSAADPSFNQTLYANIVNFGPDFRVPPVTISPSGSTGTAGETYSLTCSTTLHPDSIPFPFDVPSPTFEWFFGPNNSSLPSGVTPMATAFDLVDTFTSTLQFSQLRSQSHAGMYTCRLGPGRLANHAIVTVNAPAISVQITTNGSSMLGHGYSLTCGVNGAGNLNSSIIYEWTDGTTTQVGTNSTLSFSPLRLSDAGQYICRVSVNSPFLDDNNNDIKMMGSQEIRIQILAPAVTLSSSIPNPIPPFGSDVTLTCSVELSPAVDVPVNVNVQLTASGSSLPSTTLPSVSGSTFNITTTIASFRRDQSGLYTCTATVSLSSNTFISDSNSMSDSISVTTGVYLALRDAFITKDSNVNIMNIGQSSDNPNGALQCITDKDPCCDSPTAGEWRLPGGTAIQEAMSTTAFHVTRGSSGQIQLNRPSGVMLPVGRFCCQVPDASNTNQMLCVNIGGVSIMASGSPTAGESYTLECSAGGSEGTFQWLGPPDGRTPVVESTSRSIVSNATTSQLQFRPLQQSHNGSYLCNVSTGGLDLTSQPAVISVNAPSISVRIDEPEPPTIGMAYTLSCSVSGAENLTAMINYVWMKNGSQISSASNLFDITALKVSDAANYVCMATISSSYLTGNVVETMSMDVRIRIPPPSSVTLTSSEANSIEIIGSHVTLTCTVELGPVVMESEVLLLMVDAQLSRDETMFDLTLTNSDMTSTTFIYTTQVESFGRNDSGNYTCTATVRPQSTATYLTGNETVSDIVRVTTGVYLSLNSTPYTNGSYILIANIGEKVEGNREGEELLCYTDNTQCCNNTSMTVGRWFQLGGEDIGVESGTGGFYISRGPSVVRLHKKNSTTSPTGLFCCEVPDARSMTVRTCANIVTQLPQATDFEPQRASDSLPTIVGAVIAGLVLLIVLAVIIIIIIVILRRRSSSKPYEVSKGKTSVLYSKQKNGDRLLGIGIQEPKFVEFPSDTNITEGEGLYFKIKVSGEPQPTVTWYHDGEPVRADYARDIEADGSLTIPSTELKHSGVYKAVVANQYGSEEREIKLTVSEEGGVSKTDIGETVKSRPIPIPEFGNYVSELHANSNKPFKDLYEALDSGEDGHGTSYATDSKRKPLNRFGNIVVYDDNRITLEALPEVKDCKEDYINACYMDGYSVPNKFIATQGPIPKTVVDFWRLIWQEHPPTIIMVTNLKEGSRIKCQKYWPDSGQETYGPFQVIITDQQVFADYTVRTLSVSLGSGRSHKVTQYHFTAWPDHGVPDYATPILAFHRRVKAQHHPSRGPMVVHCSAGVGRTGTFIAIDNILEQIEKEQVVDIPGAITKIRQRRMKMVQTHEQFTFIHDAILESVTCGDTQISATDLRTAITKLTKKNGFQDQMKVLEQVSPNPNEVQCSSARGHSDKNRGNQFLPADRWRVTLKGEQPDYIHAVNINGYKHQRAFIIAQGPLPSTVRNFWKMIYDRKSAVIVMVSDLVEGGQEASAQYWPSSGIAKYGGYTVDLLGEEPLQGFTIRTLSVMDSKTQKAHQVTQFHITCWRPDGHCSNLKCVTDVIEEMTKVQIRSGNKPIVVHCSDTVTRSGMFCAIATTIERCKTEGVVDVFQVVKALRVQKPGAVPTVDQYRQIFETILVFLESFDTYANFQM